MLKTWQKLTIERIYYLWQIETPATAPAANEMPQPKQLARPGLTFALSQKSLLLFKRLQMFYSPYYWKGGMEYKDWNVSTLYPAEVKALKYSSNLSYSGGNKM